MVEPQTAPAQNPETLMAAKWRAYHVILMRDPDSEFEGASYEKHHNA
jgi:hypothetical protein